MADPASSPVPAEAAIHEVVTTFLSCLKKRDKALMLSLILPKGGATLLRRGEPQHMSLEGVVNRIPFTPDYPIVMDEQAYNVQILVDKDIAMAWTPYVFYSDEKLHHSGTNIFTLLKQGHDGKWVISGISDVAREVPGASDDTGRQSGAAAAQEPEKEH